MKGFKTVGLFLIALFIFSGCGQKQENVIEDITASNPDQAKVIFENEYVQATEFTLQPGDKLPLHKGGARVVYALTDYTILWTEGGETSEKSWQAGDIHWHDAIVHAVENTGETKASYLVVTRKDMPLPDTGDSDLSRDASQLDSKHSQIILENDHLRVIEVNLGIGESQPKHDGLNRLIYSLSDYRIEYTYNGNNTVETELAKGMIHWHTADNHSVKNIGETPVHYVLFSFKD